MSSHDLALFALSESRPLAEKIARVLGVSLSAHEERSFEDGEHKTRPLCNVRGRDVYVVQSLHSGPEASANDKLCRLLFFVGALKDASAARVTVVAPYLCYARKDRKTKSRDPVITRYVARLLEAVDTDRVVTLDVHNLAAFENAFRCRIDHLEARKLFIDQLVPCIGQDEVAVVSPDVGGAKRAEALRLALERRLARGASSAFLEKFRSAGQVTGEAVVGDVGGRVAVIIDDLISTGGTIARAVQACRSRGAKRIYAVATHGVFVGEAARVLATRDLERLIITDTIPPFRLPADFVRDKLTVLESAPLFAEAIRRTHDGGSLVDLLEV